MYRLHGLGTCRLQSLLLISVLVTEIQQPASAAREEFFQPKDLVWIPVTSV
ncbi:hypothetical protein T190_09735 [Sinorhizobium meliloti CCBAU 01290]|nr:hypothetical protein T190_09735 [Sinorhizobium meliloti CCBAU 01290]